MLLLNSPYLKALAGLLAVKSLLGGQAAKGQSSLPSFIGVAEVRSHVRGRLRLYIPSLKNNPELCRHLSDNLSRVQSIGKHEVNPLCGTVLIFYDDRAVDPRILLGAVIKLLGLEQRAENPRSIIGKEISFFMKSLNGALIQKTGGLLDLDSALLLLFVGVGSYKTFIRKTAGGITYLWWAHSLVDR